MVGKKKKAGKATATAKKPKAARNASEMLIVASKTKEALKVHDVNVASDALDGLNAWVHWLLDQAAKRAKENGRKTVRPHDFMVMP